MLQLFIQTTGFSAIVRRGTRLTALFALISVLIFMMLAKAHAAELKINILYLDKPAERLSGLTRSALNTQEKGGAQGVNLGIADSNTTGKFVGHAYRADYFTHENSDAIIQHAKQWLQQSNNNVVVANLPKTDLLALHALSTNNTQTKAPIILNIAAMDNSLRTTECRAGLLHTIPSRAMLSDALLQFTNYKRWNKILLIQGQQSNDRLFTESIERSIKRFGGKIVAHKTWSFNTDLRRVAQKEIPAFTQTKDYDIIFTADEAGFFGDYILYNSWLPRPVAGTQGLRPKGWHHSVEQWGALQLQSRFQSQFNHPMTQIDYAGWSAVRTIAEAVTRTQSVDIQILYRYILGSEFALAGFKGTKLNFRSWNGQLRQPIPLVHANGLVSQSPQEGYLHPVSELDTLGFDSPEVSCEFN